MIEKLLITISLLLFLTSCVTPTTRGPASETSAITQSSEEMDEDDQDFEDFQVQTRMETSHTEPQDVLMANTIGLSWPVRSGRITQSFDVAKSRPHLGVDIAARRGASILASHDGQVIYTGNGFHGYGKMVIVEYGDRWATLYSHLSRINVREGQKVKRSQALGVIGKTGNATGIHLHFEIRYFRQPIDPLKFLPQGQSYVSYFH